MISFFRVKGSSMLPNFKSGQIVITRKTKNLFLNDVIILKTNDNNEIIKRISYIQDKEIKVTGDNPEYNSKYYSQTFNLNNVVGKVFFKI